VSYLAQQANAREVSLDALAITPGAVARVIALVASGELTNTLARQVVDGVLAGEGTPDEVVAARGLAVVSDEGALVAAVDAALAAQPDVAEKIRGGKVAAAGAIVGAVMRQTGGKADAKRVRELVLERCS
jgi:aspartyl-tRNA(Asn)/glutamyl-tRNA(Gln) amidotransferase subunit B